MPTSIPIPATDAIIPINEDITLTGLTVGTRYKFMVTSTKSAQILLQDGTTTPLMTGWLFNQVYSVKATANTLTLNVTTLEGAQATLTMVDYPETPPVNLPSAGTPVQPNRWYLLPSRVTGEVYEVMVSAEQPVTIIARSGDSFNTAIDIPVFTGSDGSFVYTQNGTNLYLYVDGATTAKIGVEVAHPVVGMIAPQTLQLTAGAGDLNLNGPVPAGYYSVDFVTNAQSDATTYNGDLTIATPANTIFADVTGYTGADSGFVPIVGNNGTYLGNNLRGKLIVAVDAPVAEGDSVDIASIGAPTTGTSANFNGSAVLTYVGPLTNPNL